jgi:hypothetical protein
VRDAELTAQARTTARWRPARVDRMDAELPDEEICYWIDTDFPAPFGEIAVTNAADVGMLSAE